MTQTHQDFFKAVQEALPGSKVALDAADNVSGVAYLDIIAGEKALTAVYEPTKGYGLYAETEFSFNSGPRETFASSDALIARLVAIVQGGNQTSMSDSR